MSGKWQRIILLPFLSSLKMIQRFAGCTVHKHEPFLAQQYQYSSCRVEATLIVLSRYKAQKRQLQASFKEGAAKHVEELKAALQQSRDQTDRLECQKQLLLKQVILTQLICNPDSHPLT